MKDADDAKLYTHDRLEWIRWKVFAILQTKRCFRSK